MLNHFAETFLRADPCLTHLDTLETPVATETAPLLEETSEPDLALEETFRHSGWAADRQRIFEVMEDLNLPYHRRQAFAVCGSGCWVLRSESDPELYKTVPDHCHDRLCVPCGGARQAVIRRNLAFRLKDGPHRFLTLTIRHADEPLGLLLQRLNRAFRLLRQRRLWKDRVRGGVAFLELTFDAHRRFWNPHLHIIFEGLYLPLPELSAMWLACTGDSHNVKIKLIRNRQNVVAYITKYATKPLPASVVRDRSALSDAVLTLAGRRTIIAFGSWRNWRLLENPEDRGWVLFKHINGVRFHAMMEDPQCEDILAMISTADVRTGEFIVCARDPP